MTTGQPGGGGSVAISPQERDITQIVLLLSQIQQGHLNCTVQLATLTANATSTTVAAQTCTQFSTIIPSPTTFNAASQEGLMWFTPGNGQFIVNHASNGHVDMTFNFAIIG